MQKKKKKKSFIAEWQAQDQIDRKFEENLALGKC